ncbi:MAG TPA: N-acetyl sugar amidotransferase [Candidatus Moranbacteria bacterium]|nr:N-acetyl sugar amidotransferase [Candidatus Moranbacteria bacterium]
MQYCVRCVMPNTRPGIAFNSEGVCSACQAYHNRKKVNYQQRFEELKKLCDKYRGVNGANGYDCMIAVSGGKDSHFQTHVIKEVMGMNPLLVSVEDNFPKTQAAAHNLMNISEVFGCDLITIRPNLKAQKIVMRKTFEKFGKPGYVIDRYIYTYPLHMALKFNTSLLVYGENVSYEYGGVEAHETYSAKAQVNNGVASGIDVNDLLGNGVTLKDLNFFEPPSQEDLNKLDPIYLSYFVEWNSVKNYFLVKKMGFHDLTQEWERTQNVEQFDQIDNRGMLVHGFAKYAKFGHFYATDYASRMVRYGMISRQEAVEMVRAKEHNFDPTVVREFCDFLGYSEREFWEILDGHFNRDLFEKDAFDNWVLKNPVWKAK